MGQRICVPVRRTVSPASESVRLQSLTQIVYEQRLPRSPHPYQWAQLHAAGYFGFNRRTSRAFLCSAFSAIAHSCADDFLRSFLIQPSERYQSRAIAALVASRHVGQHIRICRHNLSPRRCLSFCKAALYSSLDLRPKPCSLRVSRRISSISLNLHLRPIYRASFDAMPRFSSSATNRSANVNLSFLASKKNVA